MKGERKELGKKYTKQDVVRKALKKTRRPWWVGLVVDPIVLRLLPLLANWTNLTPNQVTGVSFLCGMIAVGFFLIGTPKALIAGAVFAELWFFLDCIDGKLARLKNSHSKLGMILDYANEYVFTALSTFALSYGQWTRTLDSDFLLLSYWYITLNLLYKLIKLWYLEVGLQPWSSTRSAEIDSLLVSQETDNNDKSGGIKALFGRLQPYPGAVEAGTIVTFIGPLINQVKLGFIIGSSVLLFRFLGAVVLFFIRFYRAKKGPEPPVQ